MSELFWYWTVEVVLCAVFTAENVVRNLFVNLVLNVWSAGSLDRTYETKKVRYKSEATNRHAPVNKREINSQQ